MILFNLQHMDIGNIPVDSEPRFFTFLLVVNIRSLIKGLGFRHLKVIGRSPTLYVSKPYWLCYRSAVAITEVNFAKKDVQ